MRFFANELGRADGRTIRNGGTPAMEESDKLLGKGLSLLNFIGGGGTIVCVVVAVDGETDRECCFGALREAVSGCPFGNSIAYEDTRECDWVGVFLCFELTVIFIYKREFWKILCDVIDEGEKYMFHIIVESLLFQIRLFVLL